MEHAHAAVALPANDRILAAFLEQGSLPDIAQRLNMSLAQLATWTRENARLLADLKRLLKERCKLLTLQVESAALAALATVSNSPTATDDSKLRERALERQRKSATTILRHRTTLERASTHARGTGVPPVATAPTRLPASPRDPRSITRAACPAPQRGNEDGSSSSRSTSPKLTPSERFAQRRLAAMAST